MTRLASVVKAGFYPTPDRVTTLIAQGIVPSSTGGRLLDPCCGQGVAAQTIASAWNLDAYGIEIDANRAKAASRLLKRVLHLDYQQARIPHGAFRVLYLNPPYDYAATIDGASLARRPQSGRRSMVAPSKRVEYEFLRDTTKWLQAGGLLVYLVPQPRVDARMAGFLTTWYDAVQPFRFPDPEYAAFKQVVIFGTAKGEGRKDDANALALVNACRGELPILPESRESVVGALPAEQATHNGRSLVGYAIPAADPNARFFFRGNQIDPAEALAEAQTVGVQTTSDLCGRLARERGNAAQGVRCG